MSSSNTSVEVSGGGIGFIGALTLLFIGLKLTGHIAWSWWWVLSPLWITFAFGMFLLVIGLIVAVIFSG